ncbi:hypothetical protein BruAb2_0605 [Brucella abortus bv. 1 str. 9-941]|uniref:Uncharacterized protein n=1 Tax=Brucella abortus biovar 1 (strain 9-941) TaxID=262698 RepID=Q578B7_BRUAB|nr:hypothetical protein BruAb2_0605 [Brucella abortus bv. 1 str. 9-941]
MPSACADEVIAARNLTISASVSRIRFLAVDDVLFQAA